MEAFQQSLACQGTLTVDPDDGRAKCRPQNIYAVSDKSDENEVVALHERVDELQRALERVTKSTAALTVGPQGGHVTRLGTASPGGYRFRPCHHGASETCLERC